MKLADQLHDHCFVMATENLVELCRAIERETGQKPALGDICDVLTWALRSCPSETFADVDPENIAEIKAKVTKKGKCTLKPGDILAVPHPEGGHYRMIHITKNRFGYAYGVFEGHFRSDRISNTSWSPHPLRHCVYAGRDSVINGRWRNLGNRSDLLELFPNIPESFLERSGKVPWSDALIGPHGSGETPDGTLRHISKDEADEIGLGGGGYTSSFSDQNLERYLANKLR